jgi:putative flippase GtrA
MRQIDSEFMRFLLCGGVAAAANWCSRILFSLWLDYSVAIVLAFVTGLLTAYLLFRDYVFAPASGSGTRSFSLFLGINLLALLLTWGTSVGLAFHLLPAMGWTFYPLEVAHGCGIIAPVLASYFGHKYVTFR